jgi:lysophospholipase L1-like esterase
MFGEMKYRYRPNVGVYNIAVWSGLHFRHFAIPATLEISGLLQQADVVHQIHFETDNYGFKPTEFDLRGESFKVFSLGDSSTEGLWVDPKDTFVNLFGKELKTDGVALTPVNLGVNGYGALEEEWMLEFFAPQLHPKLAIVSLFPNDVHEDYFKVIKNVGIPAENYTHMFGYLHRAEDFCEKHDIKLVISLVPVKEQLGSLKNFTFFQDRVKAWCAEAHIMCIDSMPYLTRFGADHVYFSGDPHLSVEGYRHYTDFLYQELKPLLHH